MITRKIIKTMTPIKSSNHSLILILLIFTLGLSACEDNGVSRFNDSDIASPIPSDINSGGGIISAPPGERPADPDQLANLPSVFAGNPQNADANVLVNLRGQAEAKNSKTISQILWRQIGDSDPAITIASPNNLATQILIPDFLQQTVLTFQLVIRDSSGLINASTTSIVVTPSAAFARVIGDTVNEDQANARFQIRINSAQANDLIIDYRTLDGSALAGIDYQAVSGSLVVPAGETEAFVDVPIIDSVGGEENETFSLQITLADSEGNFRSNTGTMLIRDNQGPEGAIAPQLQDLAAQVLTAGQTISPIQLTNTGGADITSCEASALPNGLNIAPTSDLTSCIISGTPTTIQQNTTVQITASNTSGSSSIDVAIGVNPSAPNLVTPPIQNYTINESIPLLSITNNGGGQLSDCRPGSNLPDGLMVRISQDLSTCEIDGIPTVLQLPTTGPAGASTFPMFAIEARNVSGSSEVFVSLSVNEPVFGDPMRIPYFAAGSAGSDVTINIGLALVSGTAQIDWGDGSTINITNQEIFNIGLDVPFGGGFASHTYSASDSGEITLRFSQGQGSLRGIEVDGDLAYLFDLAIFENASDLEYIDIETGQFSAVDAELMLLGQNNPQLETLRLRSNFSNSSSNPRAGLYINGEVRNFPRSLEEVTISGSDGQISGLIDNLPAQITQFDLSYPNSISGNIGAIPGSLRTLRIVDGDNTIGGQLGAIPQSLASLFIEGSNTISGNIEDLHTAIGAIMISGLNTISGDLSLIPANTGLLSLSVDGNNTIGGDFTRLPANILSIDLGGNNTVFGDIQNIPSRLFNVFIFGDNTISGDIQNLPSNVSNFQVFGNNTISGDLALLTNDFIASLAIGGNNSINLFSNPPVWRPFSLSELIITEGDGSSGFSSTDLDNLLIALAGNLTGTNNSSANITITRAADAARTNTSDAAVMQLQQLGYRVDIGLAVP